MPFVLWRRRWKEGVMHLTRRDLIATVAVAAAVGIYCLWLARGASGPKLVAATVLVLGVVASASAVVPGFEELIHGSKAYLAIASLVGLGALGAGVAVFVTASEVMLAVLVSATVVLWAMSTLRHSMASHHLPRGSESVTLRH